MKMAGFSSPNSSSSTQSPSIFSSSSPSPFSSLSSSVFSNPNSSSSTQSSPIFGSSSPSPSPSPFSSSSSSTVFSTTSLIPSFSISAPPFPFEFGGSSPPASLPLFGMSITTAAPASPSSVSGLSSNVFGSFTSSVAYTNTTSESLCSPFWRSSSSNSSNLSQDFCSSSFGASSSSLDSAKPFSNSGSPFSGLPSASFLGSASPLKTQSESAFSFKIGGGSTSKPNSSPAAVTSKPNSSPAVGDTNPNSIGSGTALNIFSAVITNTSSTPAAAASTISATAASQAPPSVSFTSFSTDLSGLNFSFSTKSSATLQAQSTALLGTPFSIGVGTADKEGRVGSEGEQLRDRLVEEPVVQIVQCEPKNEEVEGLRQDHEEYVILESAGVQQSVECGILPSCSIVNEDVGTSAGSPNTKFPTTNSGVAAPSKEVQVESCENSSADSEVVSGDEISVPGVASKISFVSLCSDMNDFTPSSQNSLIVEQIITKYGDITTGSILKSVAAKSTFLQLVADVVHRLCNHTLDTLGNDEMQLIQTRTADAVAVGFHVDWLQRRVNEVTSALKHQVCTIELEQLGEKIYAAKKSLAELELQQMVWKKEVTFLKAEMEGNDFNGPNLGDGLL